MTEDELATWREAAGDVRNGGSRPCVDCPMWFARAEQAAGRCHRNPIMFVRRPSAEDRRLAHVEANRRYRRSLARQMWDNAVVGSSDTSQNRMPSAPSRSLTLQGGVAASRGQD